VLGGASTEPKVKTAASGVFWGTVSGFTSFLSQAGGPPFQVHVLPQRLPKMTLVGTTTIYFAIVNALKIGPYFALGQFSTKNFATSVMLLPLAIVFVVSALLLYQGVMGLLRG
jgi:hypothetical protein